MNDVVQFSFEGSGVRVVERDGEPWFVARDVAVLLGYNQPADAVRTHCRSVDETPMETPAGSRQTKIIPERDVYRLIMRSKLPNAEQFEEWVVGIVLPSIRKNGGYIAGQEKVASGEMTDAEFLAQAAVVSARVLDAMKVRLEAAEAKIEVLEPRAAVVGANRFRPPSACHEFQAAQRRRRLRKAALRWGPP